MQSLPAMTIAVLNDLHVGGPEGGGFQNPFLTADTTAIIKPTVDAINRSAPDLVLIPGDLTQDATGDQLATVHRCLSDLDAPFLTCKGNHDRETPEAAARFDATFGKHAPPGVTPGTDIGLSDAVAILILESSWTKDDERYTPANPPLAIVDDGLVAAALADLDALRPDLLLVTSHYPLVSQAAYVASVGGDYAGHVVDGEQLLSDLTSRARAVVCFSGHNHHHHVMTGERWLQCGTGALAEYPAEYRIIAISDGNLTITTQTAVNDLLQAAPAPKNVWVSGRPQDRELTWRSE